MSILAPFRRQAVLAVRSSAWLKPIAACRFITEETLLSQSDLGEDNDVENTGFIAKGWRESLLYYDRLMPMLKGRWDVRNVFVPLIQDVSEAGLRKRVLEMSKDPTVLTELKINNFTPVERDGGAFVRFRIPDGMDVGDFNKQLMDNVAQSAKGRTLDFLTHPRCFPVKGVPWIEDLARFPSPRISVAFDGPDLTQENLYALFRRYGFIADIIPPAPDAKLPRSATISFRNTRAAVAARQCLNGFVAGSTTLHIQYVRIEEANAIGDFISSHSRIFLPIFLALLAGLAVVIFDPIRHFFIAEKISGTFSLNQYKFYKELSSRFSFFKRRMSQVLLNETSAAEGDLGWNSIEGLRTERQQLAKNIQISLEENVNSFIVVTGPPGAGKRSLVQDQALKDRNNVLYIDCEHIIKSRKESEFIKNTASEIGYFPVFPWLTSVSSFVDLVMQGLTGQKSGLNETKESQIKNMLALAAHTIRDMALDDYDDDDESDHHMKEEDYLRQNPGAKPVIVIDRYQAAKNAHDENAFIYKAFADWAASLVTLDIAHVIFITDDVGSVQQLANVMPTAPLKRATLSDASQIAAEKFVYGSLANPVVDEDGNEKVSEKLPADTTELYEYTDKLGGRMLDLQMFVRRIQSGDQPKQAFEGLVQQATEQLTQAIMQPKDASYNGAQIWFLIKLLAQRGSVSFTDLQMTPLFKANTNGVLQGIENAEVITLVRTRGVIDEVRPAKPLYLEAFQQMVSTPAIFNSIESDYLKTLIAGETKKVNGFESDVAKYDGVEYSKRFADRLEYLSKKINTSTNLISGWEKELVSLGKSKK